MTLAVLSVFKRRDTPRSGTTVMARPIPSPSRLRDGAYPTEAGYACAQKEQCGDYRFPFQETDVEMACGVLAWAQAGFNCAAPTS